MVWVVGIAVMIVVAAVVALMLMLMMRSRGTTVRVDRVLSTHGAFRCMAVEQALVALADRGDSAAIVVAWSRLEGPLLEALTDCPPDLKPRLADALARCSVACANRAVAQSLMVLRNSLAG